MAIILTAGINTGRWYLEEGVTVRAWLGAGFCPRKSKYNLRETGRVGEGLNEGDSRGSSYERYLCLHRVTKLLYGSNLFIRKLFC